MVSEEKSWVIPTEDLQDGTSLSFDLTDASGNVLLRSGTPITERLKEILRKKNIHSVNVRGAVGLGLEQAEAALVAAFNSETMAALGKSVDATEQAILKLAQKVQQDTSASSEEINRCVNSFVDQASKDIAATLAIVALRFKRFNEGILNQLANRATKFSLLSIVASITLKHETKHTREIGLAAALHDTSLVNHPEWFDALTKRDGDVLEDYRRHPLESAELLNSIAGVSRNVITMITQVHEQCDGAGYPRGLLEDQMEPGSLILSLADAYLSMTEPIIGTPYSKADTLAYLCQHTARGKFARDSLHGFLNSMSIYPIGSVVELDDQSKAIVIAGNSGKPMQPIVKAISDTQSRRIDLSNTSLAIVGPYSVGDSGEQRIKKSQMQEILWRSDR